MKKDLERFGLSEKEAQVYLASLELGRATADQIAKQADVKRSTTYVQIESLQKMGLMSTFEEGKKTFFTPESPDNLRRVLEHEKKELELREEDLTKQLPDLVRMFESAGERPIVRFYEGKEGITTMREETLSLTKGDEILIIFSFDALYDVYSVDEIIDYTKRRVERGINVRYVYTRGDGKLDKDDIPQLTSRRYLSSNLFDTKTDIFIFDNKIAMMTLSGKLFGIVIESDEISNTFRALFSNLWTTAEKD